MENVETLARTAVPLNPVAPAQGAGSYLDWAAILGGATVALGISAVATGFGAALGLTAISAEPGEGSGWAALLLTSGWILLSMIAAYATGGYVAGRMRRPIERATPEEVQLRDGMNGLVVWALGIVIGAFVLAATAGMATRGATALSAASTTLEAPAAALVRMVGANSAQNRDDLLALFAQTIQTGTVTEADRAYLAQAVTQSGLPEPQVNARVEAVLVEADRLGAEARNLAETARISAILTGFLMAATALVSAVAAFSCAVRGGQHRDEGRIYAGLALPRR